MNKCKPITTACPGWSAWALEHLPLGLLVLDDQRKVVFANQWFLLHAALKPEQVIDKTLLEVFPELISTHLSFFLDRVISTGFPSLLSQTLHPAPFPLFVPGVKRSQDKFLRQSIRIIPMAGDDVQRTGQRYTLIQISDVTQSVIREKLLKAQADRLKSLANVDELTGLGNRRLLDEALPHAVRMANKTSSPLAVIMFDIDFFKQFNDAYGHPSGDDCLRQVAQVLREVFQRPQDIVTRYGGEEMMAVLPETKERDAIVLAELVLQKVRDLKIEHKASLIADWTTLSAGVAAFQMGTKQTHAELVDASDQALYKAKNQGRDRVCVASSCQPVRSGG